MRTVDVTTAMCRRDGPWAVCFEPCFGGFYKKFCFSLLAASLSVVPQSNIFAWFVELSLQGRFANGKSIMKISVVLYLCNRTHETEICLANIKWKKNSSLKITDHFSY